MTCFQSAAEAQWPATTSTPPSALCNLRRHRLRLNRPDWERVECLTQEYTGIDEPCLIVWGGRDEVLPVSMGYKLAEEIP